MNRYLRFIKNEFIYGSHLISFSGVTAMLLGLNILGVELKSLLYLVLTYIIFAIGFLYNRYVEIDQDTSSNSKRVLHIKSYFNYIPYILIAYSILFFTILYLSLQITYGYISYIKFLLATLVFVLPFLYTYTKGLTKIIPCFKEIKFALNWVILFFVFSFLNDYYNLDIPLILFFIFLFLRIFLATSLFDVKDILQDKQEGLKTTAVLLGEKNIFKFLIGLSITAVIPILIGYYLHVYDLVAVSLLFTTFYTILYIKLFTIKKSNMDVIYYIIIGGEFTLYFIVYKIVEMAIY